MRTLIIFGKITRIVNTQPAKRNGAGFQRVCGSGCHENASTVRVRAPALPHPLFSFYIYILVRFGPVWPILAQLPVA
jgi:hypothetical protein